MYVELWNMVHQQSAPTQYIRYVYILQEEQSTRNTECHTRLKIVIFKNYNSGRTGICTYGKNCKDRALQNCLRY
jgi:hypothetical protein